MVKEELEMSNQEALKKYDVKKYRTPDGYTSDIAVFTITTEKHEEHKPPVMALKIMLIQRGMITAEGDPNIEAGKWALPGGFVQPNETAFEAAHRELEEETSVKGIHIKHFGVYDKPGRDPRGWIISNAHYGIVPPDYLEKRQARDDAAHVELFPVDEVLKLDLAFDHKEIIETAIHLIQNDLLQTTVARNFLPEKFTYSELQAVLKTVTDDPAILVEQSFNRKIKKLPFIQKVDETTQRTSKTPAKLYRFVNMEVVNPIYKGKF